eukprot:1155839-Pelagomonas_calceolata.AAC.3
MEMVSAHAHTVEWNEGGRRRRSRGRTRGKGASAASTPSKKGCYGMGWDPKVTIRVMQGNTNVTQSNATAAGAWHRSGVSSPLRQTLSGLKGARHSLLLSIAGAEDLTHTREHRHISALSRPALRNGALFYGLGFQVQHAPVTVSPCFVIWKVPI